MSKMIIFLYGEDSYRSKEKLNEIINRYKESHKNELNLRRFEGEDLDFQDFLKAELEDQFAIPFSRLWSGDLNWQNFRKFFLVF